MKHEFFRNEYNGEVLPIGFCEYRKENGIFGYICVMSDSVLFFSAINNDVSKEILFNFKPF